MCITSLYHVFAAAYELICLIQALKDRISSLKNEIPGTAPSGAIRMVSSVEGTKEELQAKLTAYQQFIAQYIIKSQEDKLKAIKAAEQATSQKYEAKMQLLFGGGGTTLTTPASQETTLYSERNAKVAAAASAGKSRWGDMETQRAASNIAGGATRSAPSVMANGELINGVIGVPPEVKEADHGLSSDGSVGGPSLAERVAMGAGTSAAAASSPTMPILSAGQALYQQRNAMVSAAAQSGKSRWGDMEVQKATKLASALPPSATTAPDRFIPVTPEVQAADHGLRSDGSVGGPSLAERVALGASAERVALGASGPAMSSNDHALATSSNPLYQQRNVMVNAAAQAGKSRWGPMEVEKASKLATPAISSSAAPSRVNVGARLLNKSN